MNTEMDARAKQINVEYINFEQDDSPSLMRRKADSINLEVDCTEASDPTKHQSRTVYGGLPQAMHQKKPEYGVPQGYD